jgi:hypothetical protein
MEWIGVPMDSHYGKLQQISGSVKGGKFLG